MDIKSLLKKHLVLHVNFKYGKIDRVNSIIPEESGTPTLSFSNEIGDCCQFTAANSDYLKYTFPTNPDFTSWTIDVIFEPQSNPSAGILFDTRFGSKNGPFVYLNDTSVYSDYFWYGNISNTYSFQLQKKNTLRAYIKRSHNGATSDTRGSSWGLGLNHSIPHNYTTSWAPVANFNTIVLGGSSSLGQFCSNVKISQVMVYSTSLVDEHWYNTYDFDIPDDYFDKNEPYTQPADHSLLIKGISTEKQLTNYDTVVPLFRAKYRGEGFISGVVNISDPTARAISCEIRLYTQDGDFVESTISDAQGNYLFINLDMRIKYIAYAFDPSGLKRVAASSTQYPKHYSLLI